MNKWLFRNKYGKIYRYNIKMEINMKSNRSIVKYIEIFLDVVVMFVSYLVANFIKFGYFRTGLINRTEHYLTLFLLEFAAYVIVRILFFKNENLINNDLGQEIYSVIKMYVYIVVITAGVIYFGKMGELYSRVQILITFIISPVLTMIVRMVLKRIITKEYHRSGANEKVMLVTTSTQVLDIIKKIKLTRNWDFRISSIALIDCDKVGEVLEKIEVVANKENLIDIIAVSEIDSVFVHIPKSYRYDAKALSKKMLEMGKTVHLNIDDFETNIGERRLDFLGKYAVVTLKNHSFRIRDIFMKRMFDFIISSVGIALLIPVSIILYVAEFVTCDKGPLMVPVVRVGKNGRRFYYYKFRTMYVDAGSRYDRWVIDGKYGDDPRYTRIGKILKKLRLENLPSIWNVFWGDMSIVGNYSPSLPEFLNYSIMHRKSLSAKPGVFCYWQLDQSDKNIIHEDDLCELELEYITNWSLGLDFVILAKIACPFFKTLKKSEYTNNTLVNDEILYLSDYCRNKEPLDYDKTNYAYDKYKKTFYTVVKRCSDICISLLGIVLLLPVYVIITIIVWMDDGGNPFYGHLRIGYRGRKISVYKFRSMKMNVGNLEKILTPKQMEQYIKEFKIDDDPRVTKIGTFLRKTSLDELPQLFNVLRGDLSIVGPRPIIERETEMYGNQIAKFLSVKPGLTGYWQAYGRSNISYENGERQRMEMYYIDNRSLWLDIKIIFRTFVSVIKEDGAK